MNESEMNTLHLERPVGLLVTDLDADNPAASVPGC